MRTSKLPLPILVLLAILVANPVLAQPEHDETAAGKVELQSIGSLEFGPGNVLFVADSVGSAVWAFEVSPPESEGSGPIETIRNLDVEMAALLGVTPRDVRVKDMAVHEASGTIFLSVERAQGKEARPVLMQISRDGEITAVDLAKMPHSKLSIGNAPGPDVEFGPPGRGRTYTVTDLEFIDGELYIAGLSNEEFASTLRRASYPFTGDELASTGLEIYHGAHGKFETHAPIFSFIPYEIEGQTHIVAGYLCTPLVTFPLSEIKAKSRLRGKTIAELGFGNIPTDIVVYEKDGEQYLLIINTRRGVMRVKTEEIVAAQKRDGITKEVGPRTGVEDETVPLGHVAQAANFDSDHIAVLGRSMETGGLYLATQSKRWL